MTRGHCEEDVHVRRGNLSADGRRKTVDRGQGGQVEAKVEGGGDGSRNEEQRTMNSEPRTLHCQTGTSVVNLELGTKNMEPVTNVV